MDLSDVLERFPDAKELGNRYRATCPCHNDSTPSLDIAQGDTKIIVKCHAGCDTQAVLKTVGLKFSDLDPNYNPPTQQQTYDYADEAGQVLIQKVRYNGKKFYQQRWDGEGWIKKLGDVRRVLYRLPEVVDGISNGSTIFVVEGEKDADRLHDNGLVATTNIEGAAKPGQKPKWRADYAKQLCNAKQVVILPDNDEPGKAHAQAIAKALAGVVADVRIVELPGLKEKQDVSDWLNAGNTIADLEQLADGAQAIHGPQDDGKDDAFERFKAANPDLQIFKHQPQQSVMADALIPYFQNKFAFCPTSRNWYAWTGIHWEMDSADKLLVAIKDVMAKSIFTGFSYHYINNIERLLSLSLRLPEQNITRLIPFKNCLLDIDTRATRAHDPSLGFTWSLPYNFDPTADCPLFKEWLSFTQHGDLSLVELLRAFLNGFVMGRHDLEVILTLIGGGGTGKTTFITIAEHLVGKENTTATELKKLETDKFETANLFGKKLALISDAAKYGGDAEMLKRITGNDPVPYEVKGKQKAKDFVYQGMVVIAANEQPRTTDRSSGIGRRMIRVNFDRKVPQEQKDLWFAQKLCAELSGIINWCFALSDDDVTRILASDAASRANKLALVASNPVASWMNENLVFENGATTKIGNASGGTVCLYGNYLDWCENTGNKPIKLQTFSATVVDLATRFTAYDVFKKSDNSTNTKHLVNMRLRLPFENAEPFIIDEDVTREDIPETHRTPTGDSPDTKTPNSGDVGDLDNNLDKNTEFEEETLRSKEHEKNNIPYRMQKSAIRCPECPEPAFLLGSGVRNGVRKCPEVSGTGDPPSCDNCQHYYKAIFAQRLEKVKIRIC